MTFVEFFSTGKCESVFLSKDNLTKMIKKSGVLILAEPRFHVGREETPIENEEGPRIFL